MRFCIAILATLLLAGCGALSTETQRGYDLTQGWSTPSAFTTADIRMISQRQQPVLHNTVICTEPSPDVAKAASSLASLAAQGGSGNVSAGVNLSAASAEALAELAGRSTALLGLRDGLYRACEAYANGVIGQDAYSLVLSRYGQLMTTLFLGQDVTGTAGKAAASAAVPLPAAAQNTGSQPGGSQTPNKTSTTGSATAGNASAAEPGNLLTPRVILAAASALGLPPDIALAANPSSPAPAPNPGGTPQTNAPSTTTPQQSNTGQSGGPVGQPASTSSASTAAALVLGRMNEDYFSLDSSLLHLLVVACINEYDPTRLQDPVDGKVTNQILAAVSAPAGGAPPAGNSFLQKLCGELDDMATIESAEAKIAAMAGKPINPEVAAQASAAASGAKPPTETQSQPKADPVIKAVQQALARAGCPGCYPGPADGINGPYTANAVNAYQKTNGLPVNGNPKDPQTLSKLGITSIAPKSATGAGAA